MKNLPKPESRIVARVVVGDEELVLERTSGHIEAFTFTVNTGEVLQWNITKAKELVAAGHVVGKEDLDVATMASIARSNEWTADGVAAADASEPGIAAPVVGPDGETIFVIIDGVHRCVRAMLDSKPWAAWLLTLEANAACLLVAPSHLVPTKLPAGLEGGAS